jgi:hypothetical protein
VSLCFCQIGLSKHVWWFFAHRVRDKSNYWMKMVLFLIKNFLRFVLEELRKIINNLIKISLLNYYYSGN